MVEMEVYPSSLSSGHVTALVRFLSYLHAPGPIDWVQLHHWSGRLYESAQYHCVLQAKASADPDRRAAANTLEALAMCADAIGDLLVWLHHSMSNRHALMRASQSDATIAMMAAVTGHGPLLSFAEQRWQEGGLAEASAQWPLTVALFTPLQVSPRFGERRWVTEIHVALLIEAERQYHLGHCPVTLDVDLDG